MPVAYLFPPPFCTIVPTMTMFGLVFVIFKTSVLKTFLSFTLPYTFFAIILAILQTIFVLSFSVSPEDIVRIPLYRLILLSGLYPLMYLLYRTLKHFDIKITLFDNTHKSILYIPVLNSVVGVVVIGFLTYIFVTYGNNVSTHILLISVFSIVAYFALSVYSLFRTSQLETTKQQLEQAKIYNKTLTVLYDNIRMFKHDFNNIIQSIGGYISLNNMSGLKKYYSELITDCQKLNNLDVLNPEIVNDPAIYSLLTAKYYTADELDIKMNIEVFLDLTKVNMKMFELTRILGILLDNAIEASKQSDNDKIINVMIRNDARANRQIFVIENTYINKDVNIDSIFEKGFTSKETEDKKAHGLGLWEVRQILKRNTNLNLHTTKNEEFFSQQFEIYNS